MTAEHFDTCFKKGRGMAQRSLDLIEAMRGIVEAAQPITGRGVGYKLFTQRLIPSMSTGEMQKVYRLLRIAREQYDFAAGASKRAAAEAGIPRAVTTREADDLTRAAEEFVEVVAGALGLAYQPRLEGLSA